VVLINLDVELVQKAPSMSFLLQGLQPIVAGRGL